jgi:hypothetical protein
VPAGGDLLKRKVLLERTPEIGQRRGGVDQENPGFVAFSASSEEALIIA